MMRGLMPALPTSLHALGYKYQDCNNLSCLLSCLYRFSVVLRSNALPAVLVALSFIVLSGASQLAVAESNEEQEGELKFAITSAAWHDDVKTGMRLMAQNLTDKTLKLESIHFFNEVVTVSEAGAEDDGNDEITEDPGDGVISESDESQLSEINSETIVNLNLVIPAGGWAESEFSYTDLLIGNQCVVKSLTSSDWKLAEISNYALNPSVRSFIIEDIDSFRVYSCTRNVRTVWKEMDSGEVLDRTEWVLYHFERRGAQF